MGLISKIEDKLGGHKNDASTTDSKHSNTSGLNSSDKYNTTSGSHGHGTSATGQPGHSSGGLSSGAAGAGAGTGPGSSLRHPVQSAENQYGSSNTAGAGSHIPGTSGAGYGSSHTGAGSHIPGSGSTTGAGYGGPGGISSRDHAGAGGYGTETHPSLREQERMGGAGYTGPASNTIGPHPTDTANVLDPRVRPDPQMQHGAHTTAGPHQSDMMNRADPRVDSDRSKEHHYGRDAALAGGAGAAGYGAGHHGTHGSHATPREPYDPYSSAGQRTAAQREPADLLPGHQAQNPSAIPTAGGAPVGSSGYDSSHPGYDDGKKEAYRQSTMGGAPNTAGPHKNDMMNKLDPRVDSDRSKEQNHHYGRDAALAGGAGAAGYEADKHHRDHNRDHSGSHGIGSSDSPSSHTGSHGIGGSTSSPTSHSHTGSTGGVAQEKKLGGAYEAGYRDAMEHIKAEMGQR